MRAANQRLWAIAAERTQDPALGLHLAQFARPGAFGLVEYLARTAGSLLEAARQTERFARLLHDEALLRVEEDGAQVRIVHETLDGATQPPEVVDFVIAQVLSVARQLAGSEGNPDAVHLARPCPRDPTEYQRYFRATLHFGARRSMLVTNAARARAPLPQADGDLHALLRRHAEQQIAEMGPADRFLADVRAVLRETLETASGRAAEVARRLGLSERTLRRRLAECGTRHSTLLDDVRRERAFQLAAGGVVQIEAALELGYGSAAAYRRAFRRWTGTTPAAWRREHRSALEIPPQPTRRSPDS